jgi:Xaa-Pro aminopeptidase
MLLSDEPAIYRDGEYGFRTENLILVSDDIENVFGRFLAFRTMSLCYIDTELIDQGMLGKEELDWLNDYHKRVYTRLSPLLDENEKKWLQKKTLAL